MITKIIEKGTEIAVSAAITAVCGAVTYGLLAGNKNSKEEHNLRMKKLKDEYNLVTMENNAANS
jgi:hypothetical protein